MSRLAPVLIAIAFAGTAAPPAAANTVTVALTGSGFSVHVTNEPTSGQTSIVNEANQIRVEEDSVGNLLVTDSGPGADVVAGEGCALQTPDRVACPPDPRPGAILEIATGRAADNVNVLLPELPLSNVAMTRIFGGPESDTIAGSALPDMLDGDGRHGNGQEFVESNFSDAREGSDVLTGRGSSDTLLGRGGRDYLNGSDIGVDETAGNTLDGGNHSDFFDLGTSLGPDRVTGGTGGDTTVGSENVNFLLNGRPLPNGEFAQTANGDTVSYGTRTFQTVATAGVVADLDGVRDDGAVGENDQIDADVESLVGTVRDDRLTGNAAANRLEGRLGTDSLAGLDGPDRIRFREGIADKCYVPGTGDDVDVDLTDPPATLCTPKSFPLSFTTTLNASPADETMPYATIGRRVRRRGARRVIATIRCAPSAQKACRGSAQISRRLGGKALARRGFRAKPGRTARVKFRLSAARAAALKRARRAFVTSTHQGLSKVGPTTTIVARRVTR